jgi:hypothetical protein
MTRDEIIARIKACEDAIRAEGVSHLALFGSRARGDNRPDSDVDVLIDVPSDAPFSLIELSSVGLIVEDVTGLASTVVIQSDLPDHFRKRIEPDVVRVF